MVQVRLLSMTAVLTGLIWASADRLVNEVVTIDLTLTPVPAASASSMVLAAEPGQDRFELRVSGPRNMVQSARAHGVLNIRLPLSDRPTGPTTVGLDHDILQPLLTQRWSEFSKLRIVDVTPPIINVVVDHMITTNVEIRAQKLALAYDVNPQLQRVTTLLRMRESQLQLQPPGQSFQIDIGSDVERLLREKPFGKSVSVTVPLDGRPFGLDAEFQPSTIEATATVRAVRSAEQIPTVPVLIALSFANIERPLRALDRDGAPLSLVTRTIDVIGSTEAVARLVRGETRAYGIILIKEEDLEQLGVLRLLAPDYHLPPGVELAHAPDPIELQLVSLAENASVP